MGKLKVDFLIHWGVFSQTVRNFRIMGKHAWVVGSRKEKNKGSIIVLFGEASSKWPWILMKVKIKRGGLGGGLGMACVRKLAEIWNIAWSVSETTICNSCCRRSKPDNCRRGNTVKSTPRKSDDCKWVLCLKMNYIHFANNYAHKNIHFHILQYINDIHPNIHMYIQGPGGQKLGQMMC